MGERQRLGPPPSATSRTVDSSASACARIVGCSLLCALGAAGAVGCEQSDDVVANLSALSDAGPTAGSTAPPPPPDCETSELYVLFSSVVRNQCRVPSSLSTFLALQAYFYQNPPPAAVGETRPPSECDVISSRYQVFYPVNNPQFLCPDHCAAADAYVAAEDNRLLACQGF
jgi:hypothetical protein